MKNRIPNAVISATFKKHFHETLNERRHNEEFCSLFYFLPSITDQKGKINQHKENEVNQVVNGYKQFKDHRNLARTVIDTTELNRCFMKHFYKLVIRLCDQFTFNTTLYLRYSLESLKRQFCISNVLAHSLVCNRSPNSNENNSRLMMQVILLPQLGITLLSYFQAIMFLIRI